MREVDTGGDLGTQAVARWHAVEAKGGGSLSEGSAHARRPCAVRGPCSLVPPGRAIGQSLGRMAGTVCFSPQRKAVPQAGGLSVPWKVRPPPGRGVWVPLRVSVSEARARPAAAWRPVLTAR